MSQVFLPCVAGPLASAGGAAQPIFWAPLLTTLVPVVAGNPTFTFQRPTSTAYVADQDGILRLAQFNEARFQGARRVRNLAPTTENLASASWLTRSGTLTPGATDPLGGATAYTLTSSAPTCDILINGGSAPAITTGVASVWVRRRTGTGGVVFYTIAGAGGGGNITAALTSSWQRFASAQGACAAGGLFWGIAVGVAGDAIDIWHPQVEDVSGQSNQAPGDYVSVGVLSAPWHGNAVDGVKDFATTNGNSVAANVVTEATGTLIPAATLLGYVAENAATNLCLQSQNLGGWVTNAITPVLDALSAPDGTVTADKIYPTSSGSNRYVEQTVSVASATYTQSAYVKAGGKNFFYFFDPAGLTSCWFNLATGAVGTNGTSGTATITALPNGWYRCSLTIAWVPANIKFYMGVADANGSTAATVNATDGVYVWGMQLEASSDPSSYIPTTTAAVVRNLDDLRYPWVSNIDGVVGSAYSECYLPASAPSQWQTVFNNTTTGSALTSYHVTLKSLNGPGAFTANVRTLGAVNKGAVAWGGATCSVDLNGGAVAAGAYTVANYPNSGSIEIGSINITGFNLQGSIRNVKFYATRLTDVELQGLTA